VKAAAICTPSVFLIIKPSLLPQQHLCGISGWAIQDTQSPLKFCLIFLSLVISLMHIHVLLVDWGSMCVFLSKSLHPRPFFPFQLVHSDVWTSPIFSHSGYKYYIVFLDDFSHYVWTIPLRIKSDVLPTVRAFIAYVHTQFRLPIVALQTDNGCEYDSTAMRLLLSSFGTQLRLSCPYTSQQNGKAERILRTINDCVWTLLIHSAAPLPFWAEALATATWLINGVHATAWVPRLHTSCSSE
jgi:transposase InsO family protein